MKMILLPFFLMCFNYSYTQNCNDGILNGDEIRVDCGGFYCPKCPNGDVATVQNIMTHSKIGTLISNAGTLIAIDAAGERAIVSCQRGGNADHKSIYTVATDGSYFAEIYDYIAQGPVGNFTPPFVDISRDGTKVLWSLQNTGGIFVSDFNGENRRIVADKLKNQEEDSGEIELVTATSPKFNADGSAIIFSHSANGSKNRGLWKVGINQSLATNQLVNVEDLSEGFTETIWNLGGNKDFYQLSVTDNDNVQFLTNLLNENSGYSDLMIYKNGNLEMLADDGLFNSDVNAEQHDISKDGKFSFWINPWTSNAIYYKLDNETGLTTTHDLVRELSGVHSIKKIVSNYDGSLLLLSGTQTGGGAGHNVLVKSNGDEYYPIHMAHGFLNNLGSIPFIGLSNRDEKLVYSVGRSFPGPYEVWTSDVTPHTNGLDSKFPYLDALLITNNKFVPGHINNSTFVARVADGENEQVNKVLFSTFADDTLHVGYYLDPYQGSQLYDDGNSFGDADANDNRYTHNDIFYSKQGYAAQRELPYTFSVRFNLVTENHITSYDVYPFYMVGEISSVDEIENENFRIYPSLLTSKNTSINVLIDFPYTKASWKIFDMNGKKLMSLSDLDTLDRIELESFPQGTYVILFQIDSKVISKKIIFGG